MVLDAHEFQCRFYLPILPPKFVKIRHSGFLSSRAKVKLKIHQLKTGILSEKKSKLSYAEVTKITMGIDIELCLCCKTGRMIIVLQFAANAPPIQINNKIKHRY